MRMVRVHQGFTLVEVLVVTAIVAIVASLSMSVVSNAKEKANQTKCFNNLREMSTAIVMYQQDHETRYPGKDDVWSALNFPPEALACPTKGMDEGIGYGYNRWIGGRPTSDPSMPDANSLILFADSNAPDHLLMTSADVDTRHHNKVLAAYADGHVATMSSSEVDVQIIADHELFREQVKVWPQGGHRAICSNNLGAYWNSWRVNPPAGWESNLFDVNNYGGGFFGPTMGYDMYVGLTGRPHPNIGTTWSTNPDQLFMRFPVPAGARAIGEEGQWLLIVPGFCFVNAGGSVEIAAPNPAQIKGFSQISVLDDAKVPIATFALNLSGTTATYSFNGLAMQELNGVAVPNSAWPYYSPQRYKYAYDLNVHSLVMIANGGGQIDCMYSSVDNPSLAGGISAPKLAGNIHKPTWIELRVSTWATGMPGNGSVLLYTAPYSGGIWWQADE